LIERAAREGGRIEVQERVRDARTLPGRECRKRNELRTRAAPQRNGDRRKSVTENGRRHRSSASRASGSQGSFRKPSSPGLALCLRRRSGPIGGLDDALATIPRSLDQPGKRPRGPRVSRLQPVGHTPPAPPRPRDKLAKLRAVWKVEHRAGCRQLSGRPRGRPDRARPSPSRSFRGTPTR
jgi:hypothetical protein